MHGPDGEHTWDSLKNQLLQVCSTTDINSGLATLSSILALIAQGSTGISSVTVPTDVYVKYYEGTEITWYTRWKPITTLRKHDRKARSENLSTNKHYLYLLIVQLYVSWFQQI